MTKEANLKSIKKKKAKVSTISLSAIVIKHVYFFFFLHSLSLLVPPPFSHKSLVTILKMIFI